MFLMELHANEMGDMWQITRAISFEMSFQVTRLSTCHLQLKFRDNFSSTVLVAA
jgi:hypothetical protein